MAQKTVPTPTPDWEQISPYKQIRLRTEYVYGSRDLHNQVVLEYGPDGPFAVDTIWIPAIFTMFREIIDNSLDEVITHKHGNRIDIEYDSEFMTFSVEDNGQGIPIDWSDKHQQHAATVLLSGIFAGRNYKDMHGEDRGEARGLNGMGAKGVNYCSEWFQVEVLRDKQQFNQRFQEGEELIIEDAIVLPDTGRKTGTKIKFALSKKVFPSMILPESFVEARIREIAICYPNLHITYNKKRILIKDQTKDLFGSMNPIVFDIDHDPETTNIGKSSVQQKSFKAKFWLVPNFIKDTGTDFSFSLVNAIPLFMGGTHLEAIREGFYTGILRNLEKESKKRKLDPSRADIADGLLIYNIMDMSAPSFDSQAKTRLINENAGSIVLKYLQDEDFFKNIIKKYPEWIEDIYTKCFARTKNKDDFESKRQAKRNIKKKIESLKDACGTDRTKCILFLAEGDSAVSGIAEAGNPEIHGTLPLRGKVLNVYGKSIKDVLANETLSKIMNSIHLIPGDERVNRRQLRYGKIYLAMDADEDGKNICSLLVNFFYTLWPDLFDPERDPFIYVFDTPLIIAKRGKRHRYWYSENADKFDPEENKGFEITRAKGLAGLKEEDWKYVLNNPKIVPIIDDRKLKESLSLLFAKGNNDIGEDSASDKRKEWIGL